jgi:hypothetical protein
MKLAPSVLPESSIKARLIRRHINFQPMTTLTHPPSCSDQFTAVNSHVNTCIIQQFYSSFSSPFCQFLQSAGVAFSTTFRDFSLQKCQWEDFSSEQAFVEPDLCLFSSLRWLCQHWEVLSPSSNHSFKSRLCVDINTLSSGGVQRFSPILKRNIVLIYQKRHWTVPSWQTQTFQCFGK